MSGKTTPNNQIFSNVTVVTNTVTSSKAVNVIDLVGFCTQLSFNVTSAGGLTGSVKLQGSIDKVQNFSNPDAEITNWFLISGSSADFRIPSGSLTQDHNIAWNWDSVYFTWMRPVVTVTNGTGSIVTGRFAGKNY